MSGTDTDIETAIETNATIHFDFAIDANVDIGNAVSVTEGIE